MKELIDQVCQKTGVSQDQATQAVSVIVGFLKQRLPPPFAGQVESLMSGASGETGGGVVEQIGSAVSGIAGQRKAG